MTGVSGLSRFPSPESTPEVEQFSRQKSPDSQDLPFQTPNRPPKNPLKVRTPAGVYFPGVWVHGSYVMCGCVTHDCVWVHGRMTHDCVWLHGS